MGCYLFEPISSQSKAGTERSPTCFLVAPLKSQIPKLWLPDLPTEPIQCLTCVTSFPFLPHWRPFSITPAHSSLNPYHTYMTLLPPPKHSLCQCFQTTYREPESTKKIPMFMSTTTDCCLPSLHSLRSMSTKRTNRPLMALKTTWTAKEMKRIGPEQERKELRKLRAQGTMWVPCKHQAGLLLSMRAMPMVIEAGGSDWKSGGERMTRTMQWTSTGSPHEVCRAVQMQRGSMLTLPAQTIHYWRARWMSTRSSKSAGSSL